MRRWIFNILAAVSLVLCLAVAGLWVRSYWCCDNVAHLLPADGRIAADGTGLPISVGPAHVWT